MQESDTPWATRWDNYLHIFDPVRLFTATFLFRLANGICFAAHTLVQSDQFYHRGRIPVPHGVHDPTADCYPRCEAV